MEQLLRILKEQYNDFGHKVRVAIILQLLQLCELLIEESLLEKGISELNKPLLQAYDVHLETEHPQRQPRLD